MGNINLIVSSTSVIFIGLAIVISILFPDNPSVYHFSLALFWWFLSLGPLRWVHNRIDNLLGTDNDTRHLITGIIFLIAEVVFLIVGVAYFVRGIG